MPKQSVRKFIIFLIQTEKKITKHKGMLMKKKTNYVELKSENECSSTSILLIVTPRGKELYFLF